MKINTFIIGLFISSICFGDRTPQQYLEYLGPSYGPREKKLTWLPPANSNGKNNNYLGPSKDNKGSDLSTQVYNYNQKSDYQINTRKNKLGFLNLVFNDSQLNLYDSLEIGPSNNFDMRFNPLNERLFWMVYSLPESTINKLNIVPLYSNNLSFLVDNESRLFTQVKSSIGEINTTAINSSPIKNLINKIGISSSSPYYATLAYNLFINFTVAVHYQSYNTLSKLNTSELFDIDFIKSFTNSQGESSAFIEFLLNHTKLLLNPDLILEEGIVKKVLDNFKKNISIPELQNKSFDEFITDSKPENIHKGNTTKWNEFHLKLDSFLQKLYGTDFDKIRNTQTGSKNGVSIYDYLKKSYELPDSFNSGYTNSCRSLFK